GSNSPWSMRAPSITGLTWSNILSQANANVGDGDRRNLIRYVSPTFWGFTFSSSWGEDDFWDTALRYANEFNGVRVAAGIGYQKWTDGNARTRFPEFLSGGATNNGVAADPDPADLVGVDTGSQGDRGCADLSNSVFGTGGDDV